MSLFPIDGPDPYRALTWVLARPKPQQRHLLRLEVWCENNKCAPLRVFELPDGLLVLCRSDADVSDMQAEHPHLAQWSRRRAFFIEEWLANGGVHSHLQVVCACSQTTPRLVDVQKLLDAIPEAGTLTITLPQVTASPV